MTTPKIKACTLPRDQLEGLKGPLQVAAKEAVTAAVKEVARASMDPAEVAAIRKGEEDRCRRPILIHIAYKWVWDLNYSFSLAEAITAKIHKSMAAMNQ